MLRTWAKRAGLLAALTAGLLSVAGPSYATTAPHQVVGAVHVSVRVAAGDTAWNLAVRHCGSGHRYRSMTITSPGGTIRDLFLIYPGDVATIPCARYGRSEPTQPPQTNAGDQNPLWAHPLPGARCRSPYGWRPAIYVYRDGKKILISKAKEHQGADLSRASGTPIQAAHAGTVVRTGRWRAGYGISVAIHHGGTSYTFYGHNSASLVRVGQRVSAGQVIARVGSTGASTGPHLHFEIWSGWKRAINPTPYLRAHGVRLGCAR